MRRLQLNALEDLDFKDKNVFMRADFNVPIRDGKVIHDLRIQKILPSIRLILEKGGRLLLASHLGRPGGRVRPKLSLAPVAKALADISGLEIIFIEEATSPLPRLLLPGLKSHQALLLENLRFHPGEEAQDIHFAKRVAGPFDIYVNEGFGIAHREHASVTLLPELLPHKALGLQFAHEMEMLDRLKSPPASRRPFCVILGGGKLKDKFPLMEALIDPADEFVIGGLMAYPFLKAMGRSTGDFAAKPFVSRAKEFMERLSTRGKRLFLPVDHTAQKSGGEIFQCGYDIPSKALGRDIGPKTLSLFKERIARARSVFWNGPMGFFEKEAFRRGSLGLAEALAQSSKAFRIVGGGHSALAIGDFAKDMDYVSTGGGAALAYLKDGNLPGLKSLISQAPTYKEDEPMDEESGSQTDPLAPNERRSFVNKQRGPNKPKQIKA